MSQNSQENGYKVLHSRTDVPESEYCSFDAENDNDARKRFEEYKNEPALAWDRLRLLRIDRPTVKELVTVIEVHRDFLSD